MAEFNSDGGLEVSPGPRGFSVTGYRLSADGKVVYFQTDRPAELNGIALPIGPQGPQGIQGDPGEARLRIDTSVGYRVFLWDAATAGENQIYGDTGTWTLPDGTTWVRRSQNTVVTNAADPTDLPYGFHPAVAGSTDHYLTFDPWPTEVTGTITTAPLTLRGLEGYQSALAQGYPGTAEEWMNMVYRVVLPPEGDPGQVLTRTAEGSAWINPPYYGPSPWDNIALDDTWIPDDGSVAQVRNSAGTIEMIGRLMYVGPQFTVGGFAHETLRIGAFPPAYAPAHSVHIPITTYRASDNEPSLCAVFISNEGVISVGAYAFGTGPAEFTVKPNVAQINLSAVTYPLRNS